MSSGAIKKRNRGLSPGKLIVLTLTALLFLFPFYWMFVTALKPQGYVYVLPPKWFPVPLTFRNFADILPLFPFFSYLWNTIYSSTLSAVGQTTCSALAAYAFARMRWKGRNAFFVVTISTMMIPPVPCRLV